MRAQCVVEHGQRLIRTAHRRVASGEQRVGELLQRNSSQTVEVRDRGFHFGYSLLKLSMFGDGPTVKETPQVKPLDKSIFLGKHNGFVGVQPDNLRFPPVTVECDFYD